MLLEIFKETNYAESAAGRADNHFQKKFPSSEDFQTLWFEFISMSAHPGLSKK